MRVTTPSESASPAGQLIGKPRSSWPFGLICLAAAALIAAATWGLLRNVPMSHDVSFVCHTAGRMLEGARLYQDVVEANPPLVYWLSVPPVWLARALHLDRVMVFNAYVSVWILASLMLSWRIMRALGTFQGEATRRSVLIALVFIGFVMIVGFGVSNQFGQREHLVWVLTVPYLFTAVGRAAGSALDPRLRLVAGLFAGLGVALKPFFLLLWLLVELYVAVRARTLCTFGRLESIAVGAVQASYGVLVAVLTPGYLRVTRMALAVQRELPVSLGDLLWRWEVWFWLGAGLAILLVRLPDADEKVAQVLFLAATAFLASALLQARGFDYHYYPSVALVALLLVVMLWRRAELQLERRNRGILRAASVIFASLLVVASFVETARICVARHAPQIDELTRLITAHARGGFVYQLASTVDPLFPAIDSTDAHWMGHFNALGLWLAPYARREAGLPPYNRPAEMGGTERLVFETVINDLRAYPAALLIVETSPCKLHFGCRHFDFLEFFGQDENFRTLMGRYTFLRDLTPNVGFTYVVYLRR